MSFNFFFFFFFFFWGGGGGECFLLDGMGSWRAGGGIVGFFVVVFVFLVFLNI